MYKSPVSTESGIPQGWCTWYSPKRTPLATQLQRPNTPSIRGSSTPRKSSSPRTVLNAV